MVENKIRDLLFLRLKNLGYHLIRIKLINVTGRKTLQIMAERIKDREMSIEDCSFLSGQISSLLEVEDVIEGAYRLEISSPGIDRSLTRIEDFSKYKNFNVKVVKGNATVKGELAGYSSKTLNIRNKSGVSNIEISDIKDIKLDIDKMSFEKLKKMESL